MVAEANTFKQGWGQWIFASASEIAQREKLKGVLEEMPKIKQEQGGFFDHRVYGSELTVGIKDRIYASLKAKHPATIAAPTTAQITSVPSGQSTTATALESSTEGLLNRAAASVVQEKPEEEISSGASTPQKSGASSGKVRPSGSDVRARADLVGLQNTPGSSKKKGKRK